MDAVNSLIDRFERILSDIRESRVDDSVCGLCEYDGAYMGQSGDWCNECPGFDKDDCFKLSDECRKRWLESVELPSAQPEITRCKDCKNWDTTWTNNFSPNYHYCPMVDGVRKEDWYCADAERRTDESNMRDK